MAAEDGVLIVGGGPVGTVTGLAIARAGIPVTVLEAQEATPTEHRAATTHASTLDMLAPLGMTERLIDLGYKAPKFQYRDAVTGELVAEFDFSILADVSDHPFALQVEQHKTQLLALELARKLPHFSYFYGRRVTRIVNCSDHVEATATLSDGGLETHRARFLVGCDGGSSPTRKSQGIDFPGFTWSERFIIIATHFDFGTHDKYARRNYLAHPDLWCALMSIPGEFNEGVWRVLMPVTSDASDEIAAADESIREQLDIILPFARDIDIFHRALYIVHQRVAQSFRIGRVLLAGDAAHVNNPLGGMGLNGGIHDGLNLAGKIAAIWRGEGDEEKLLDLYDRQRRPAQEKYVQAQSIQNKQTISAKDPTERRRRFDDLRRTADDPKLAHDYLRRASLIAMAEEAGSIT